MTESRLRPKVVLWWGIGLAVAGLLLNMLLPQVGYALTVQVNASTPVDQGMLTALTVVLDLIRQTLLPLGIALIAASMVMAYIARVLGLSADVEPGETGVAES
ncbi:hypothetical protein [Leifsonia sp. 1010]|uniref:hypothetical protein n=1 Tax=Leifsonia sp. 1010 TaxID=2817769 RepID=UPI002854E061|nr:hypothetical protein [Leifsonia sp. 1010]MDR6612559.1 hypothetical protein [Leifsonia sp. 1010]